MRKNKISNVIKKAGITACVIFIATLAEIYWAMGSLSVQMSSGCPECSFLKEAFYMSAMTAAFLAILFLFATFVRQVYIRCTIEFILLLLVWLFWNLGIFQDSKASWSTSTSNEEMNSTISMSFFPMIILAIACIGILNFNSFKKMKNIT